MKKILNKIVHGDCLKEMKNIDSNSVVLTLTDIPYDQTNKRKSNGLRKFEKDKADVLTFDLNIFLSEIERITNGSVYIFCSTEQVSEIRGFFDEKGWSTRLCIWEKTNPSPANGQYLWLSGVETCVYARKPKRLKGNPVFNEHCKNTVWRFPNGKSKIHPTEKPLSLFKYLIEVSSNEGDLVFDPCIGSGTTAIAAKELNRNFIGIEIEWEYCLLANERLNKHQGTQLGVLG